MKRLVAGVFVLSTVGLSGGAVTASIGGGLPESHSAGIAHLRAIERVMEQDLCTEWVALAANVGWPLDKLDTLTRIIHRESRCIPTACSTPDRPDLRRCRDWGLTQINDYSWKRTVRSLGLDMEQMTDPYWNLWFAWWLYNYSEQTTGCGWTPWSIKCANQDRA